MSRDGCKELYLTPFDFPGEYIHVMAIFGEVHLRYLTPPLNENREGCIKVVGGVSNPFSFQVECIHAKTPPSCTPLCSLFSRVYKNYILSRKFFFFVLLFFIREQIYNFHK